MGKLFYLVVGFFYAVPVFAGSVVADGYCFGGACVHPNDGIDDSPAINDLIKNSGGKTIVFDGGVGAIYEIGQTIYVSSERGTIPMGLDGGGATFQAMSQLQGPILVVENPHASLTGIKRAFSMYDFVLDGVDQARSNYGLKVHGVQHASFKNIVTVNQRDAGVLLYAEANYGIYYSEFENMLSFGNKNSGFIAQTYNDQSYRIASITFKNSAAQFNGGYGFKLDYASVTFVGSSSEKNGNCGVWIDHALSVDWFGGYTEGNKNVGGFDFCGTSNTRHANIFGGRIVNFNPANAIGFTVFGSSYSY